MENHNKSSKNIAQLAKYLLAVLAALVVPMLIINFSMDFGWFKSEGHGSDDGWLGFWGGYLGAVVSIGGLYWQTNKQIKNENDKVKEQIKRQNNQIKLQEQHRKEDIDRQRERYYMESRPFFSVEIGKISAPYKSPTYVTNQLEKKRPLIKQAPKFSTFGIIINNFSEKPMLAVEVTIVSVYPRMHEEVVRINRIDKNSSAQIITSSLNSLYDLLPGLAYTKIDDLNEYLPGMLNINLCTEKREKMNIQYKINPYYDIEDPDAKVKIDSKFQISYIKKENVVTENQYPKAFTEGIESVYSLDRFIESSKCIFHS